MAHKQRSVSEEQPSNSKPITVMTVYTPHEANTYLLDDFLKDPTHAKVIRRLKYQKPPVVRLDNYDKSAPVGRGGGGHIMQVTNLPETIELEFINNEGFIHTNTEAELLLELVEKFNALIEYLKPEETK